MTKDGELVANNGQLVPDNGELVGNNGELVGNNGELVDNNGELVANTMVNNLLVCSATTRVHRVGCLLGHKVSGQNINHNVAFKIQTMTLVRFANLVKIKIFKKTMVRY